MTYDRAVLWGLTPREFAVFEILMKREMVHRDVLCGAIWGDKPVNQENMIKQIVCRLRPKLLVHAGIRIVSHKGFGYSIPAHDKRKVRR